MSVFRSQISVLQRELSRAADVGTKVWWENYVKDSAPFRGVKMPVIRAKLHAWHEDGVAERLDQSEQVTLALNLIERKFVEDKLAGILFLEEILLPRGAIDCRRDLERFAALFHPGGIYDWNVCDWFCVKVLGPMIRDRGKRCASMLAQWRSAPFLWQARAALVPFVNVAHDTAYHPMIAKTCNTLIRREERFAKTAVGWVLRDVSKHDRGFVERVLEDNLMHFSLESLRNATKYFDKARQQDMLMRLRSKGQ